jgi:uncharacterized protein (DUF433 family)
MKQYQDHIEISSEKRFGQPCIKGTRISVYDILSMLASGMSHEQILEDFSALTEDSIRAALLYAAGKEHTLRIAS